jgi:sensor histidine kinase YesM
MINACQSQLSIYLSSIQSNFTEASRDLNEISVKFIENAINYGNESELNKYLLATELRDVLSTKIMTGNSKDGLFVLKPGDDLLLVQFSNRIYANERTQLTDFLNSEKAFSDSNTNGRWIIKKIDGRVYLLKSFTVYDFLIGAVIKADSLLSFIEKDPYSETMYVLTNHTGEILSRSVYSFFRDEEGFISNDKNIIENYKNKYFIVSTDVPEINGRFSCIIERRNVFSGLNLIQWVIIFLGIISVFTIPFVVFYLFESIVKPVQQLIIATREVEQGNWDYNITVKKAPIEFAKLNESFFSMVKEIKTLKIDSYEEKIERQKAELKYLQMQIKPHFFLNVLTTISSLTYQGRNIEIRQLIEYLSRHLRYMFRGGLVLVPVIEEIEHVKNYIRLLEVKFPNNIFHMIEIEPGTYECLLPQFIIRTFVENCFKHALSVDKMLSILIKTEVISGSEGKYLRIIIEDNGDGFPEDIIETINNNSLEDEIENGRKIGIVNIKKTLVLLYKKSDLLKISNCEPSGARVEISVPFKEGESNALSSCG